MPGWANGKVARFKPESYVGSNPTPGTKFMHEVHGETLGSTHVARRVKDLPYAPTLCRGGQMEKSLGLDPRVLGVRVPVPVPIYGGLSREILGNGNYLENSRPLEGVCGFESYARRQQALCDY